MFSRILIKLVDEAIIPAVVLVVARVGSVIFFGRYFNLPVTISPSGFVYADEQGFLIINSYSTLVMISIIGIGLLYILLKSYIFHDSHIHPSFTAKLFSLRLSSLIQTSFDVYSQGVIWLSYSYLLLTASAVMAYFGFLFPWVLIVSLVITLLSTYLFVVDIESEVAKPGVLDEAEEVEEVVLTLDIDEL